MLRPASHVASARGRTAREPSSERYKGMREVGVLLSAFASLDAVPVESPAARVALLLFLAFGGFLFLAALVAEWRCDDDH